MIVPGMPPKEKLSRWITSLSLPVQITTVLRRGLASDFLHKVAELYATRILLLFIGFGTSVLVSRALGPEGRGLYGVAVTVSGLGMQFGNLGLHASNTYYVAQDRSLLSKLVANTLFWSFVVGGLGVGVAWLLFTIWPSVAPLNGMLLFLALVWIPVGLAYLLMQNLLLGIQDIRRYNSIEFVNKMVSISLIGFIIIRDLMSVELLFGAGLFALIMSFAWSLMLLSRRGGGYALPSYALFRTTIRYGLRAYVAAFLAYLTLRVDLFLVKGLSGATQAGYYSIAMSLADMIYLLPSITGAVLFPRLAAMSTVQEKWKYTKRISCWLGGGIAFLIGIGILLLPTVLPLVFGEDFTPAVPVAQLLFTSIFFYTLNAMLDHFLASIGFPLITLVVWGATLIVKISLGYALLPAMGIEGVALSAIISYLFLYLCHLFIIQKRLLPHV